MSIYDRSYMRTNSPAPDHSRRPIWILIAINVALLFVDQFRVELALDCSARGFRIYQLLTAGFIHADFWHLLFNMYGLYLFGSLVAPHLKEREFYWLYLVGVLTGNLIFWVFNFETPARLVGASGAVCAVMAAAAMFEPDRRFVMIFFPFFPLKTSTLVVVYTILEIIYQLNGLESGIAHLAHLGGFLGGYILLKIIAGNRLSWDPLHWKRKITVKNSDFSASTGTPVSGAELDYLLDKVSRGGINSLTPEEYARLRQAREEMRR